MTKQHATGRLYVGSYTGNTTARGTTWGIRVLDVEPGTARYHDLRPAIDPDAGDPGAPLPDPSFLVLHPAGDVLYAVSETAPDGAVVALAIDPHDGSLVEIDRRSSGGAAPCHLAVDPSGSHLAVANYGSGTVLVVALGDDGRFGEPAAVTQHVGSGPHPRQEAPHAHGVTVDAAGRRLHAVDLGTDRIVQSALPLGEDGARLVGETVLAPGSGPRHLVLHPQLPLAFVVCELDNTLVTLEVDVGGTLTPRDVVSVLPATFDRSSDATSAEVTLHPNGDRIYVSTRGPDSIAAFALADPDLPPQLLGHVPSGGRTPRHMVIDPTGRWLLVANQDSECVVEFDLDGTDGVPTLRGLVADVRRPVCLVFADATPETGSGSAP